MTTFDKKFGETFIKGVPPSPGVYFFRDADGSPLYVGKANHLRKRLQQYRRAGKKKKDRKLRKIVRHAIALDWTVCESEKAALLLEIQKIQEYRPVFNVEGSWFFLYPMMGVAEHERCLTLCLTTLPDEQPLEFEWAGAWRSRAEVREAFDALTELLRFVYHPEPPGRLKNLRGVKYTTVRAYRNVAPEFASYLIQFLRGESKTFLSQLLIDLLEKPDARFRSAEVQEKINTLKRFYRNHARPLYRTLQKARPGARVVTQAERDALHIESRFQ